MIRLLSSILVLLCFLVHQASAIEVNFEEDRGLPLVHLNVAIKTGYVSDPKGKSGLSSFTGQAMLRGTKKKSKDQIDLLLDQIGAAIDFDTRAEMMVLRGSVLSDQVDTFLSLIEEMLTSPSFKKTEINKLKKETVSAILSAESNDRSLGFVHFQKQLFGDHPFGNYKLGSKKEVQSFTRTDVKDHFQKLFVADGMLVVGSGDTAKSKISKWAKKLKKLLPGRAIYPAVPKPKKITETKVVIVDKPDRSQAQIYIGQLAMKLTDPSYFPMYIANHTFGGGGFTTRMFTQVRKERSWSYSAYSRFKHGTQSRFWLSFYFPKNSEIEPSLKYVLKMISDFKAKGITGEEFVFSRNSILNGAGFMYNTAKKRNENIILEKTLNLPNGFMKSYEKRIKRVSLKSTNKNIKQFIDPSQQLILVLGTASKIKDAVSKATGVPLKKIKIIKHQL